MVKKSQKNTQKQKKGSKEPIKAKAQVKGEKMNPFQLRKMILKRWKGDTEYKRKGSFSQMEGKEEGKKFQRLFGQMKEEYLNCPICLDYCLYPVLTECGHYYCLTCFEQAHRFSECCCVCRGKINTFDYEINQFLKALFEEYIRTQIDWSEAQIYWNRERELARRESRRSLNDVLRIGQMVDFRHRKVWMEAKIVSFQDRNIELLCFDLDNKKEIRTTVGRNSRALARYRSFTMDPKISIEEKKIPPVISIYIRPYRRRRVTQIQEEGVEPVLSQRDIQAIMNQRARRTNWQQDLRVTEQVNPRSWLIEDSQPIFNPLSSNIWDLSNLVEEDQDEDNFFQLVL